MTVLPPEYPDKVDQVVSAHLQRTLDTQRGRAVAAFREQMKAPRAYSFEETRVRSVRRLRIWAGAASALAACLAVAVTLQGLNPPNSPPTPSRNPAESLAGASLNSAGPTPSLPPGAGNSTPSPLALTTVDSPAMNQVELSRDLDGGVTILPDETPARVIREQTLRHMQWVDPDDHATYSITEPVEKVGYVRIQPN